jgi:hypothetical protein
MSILSVKPLPTPQITAFTRAATRYNQALNDLPSGHPIDVHLSETRGLTREDAVRFGLGIVTDDEFGHWRGAISIPSLNGSREVSALKFRNLGDSGPKYGAPRGLTQPLFNLAALLRVSDTLVLTEGEFDALAVEKAGFPAVGIPGAQAWKPFFPRMFESIPYILFCYDNDDAGNGLLDRLRKEMNVIPVGMPEGIKDPSEVLAQDPSGDLLRQILGRASAGL